MGAIILITLSMIAICFYTFDSYNELKEVAADKEALCDTYADWLVDFTKTVKGLKEQGLEVEPISINIGELKKWCKENKLKNTSSTRSRYVVEICNSSFPRQ